MQIVNIVAQKASELIAEGGDDVLQEQSEFQVLQV